MGKHTAVASRSPTDPELRSLVCVIVTYSPDLEIFARELAAIPLEVAIVLVDNGSGRATTDALTALIAKRQRARVVANGRNHGLAAAINQGVNEARQKWPEIKFLLLLDQDSEPRPDSIELLFRAHANLLASGETVGCVGPALLDADTGMRHGFHQATRWRWRRLRPSPTSTLAIRCTNLNGSGTFMRIELFLKLGGLEEEFFIDHVDTEWAFRVLAAGYSLWGIPNATFVHRMGSGSIRFWLLGWHLWPSRIPRRHYFLFRNATRLMRRDYVPTVWKCWAAVKLVVTAAVHGLFGPQRLAQLRAMTRGVTDGYLSARGRH